MRVLRPNDVESILDRAFEAAGVPVARDRIGPREAYKDPGPIAPVGVTYRQVVEMVKDGMMQRDIAKRIGISAGSVSYHIKRARERGEVI